MTRQHDNTPDSASVHLGNDTFEDKFGSALFGNNIRPQTSEAQDERDTEWRARLLPILADTWGETIISEEEQCASLSNQWTSSYNLPNYLNSYAWGSYINRQGNSSLFTAMTGI